MLQKSKGFTLVEMMITVAIIGILVRLAYPSYLATVKKSNRSEAKTELMDIQQRLQRCYSAYGRFDDPNNTNLCAVFEDLTDADGYTTRGKGYYKINFSVAATQSTYTLQAVAKSGTSQTSDKDKSSGTDCSTLTLDEKGNKLPTACW